MAETGDIPAIEAGSGTKDSHCQHDISMTKTPHIPSRMRPDSHQDSESLSLSLSLPLLLNRICTCLSPNLNDSITSAFLVE